MEYNLVMLGYPEGLITADELVTWMNDDDTTFNDPPTPSRAYRRSQWVKTKGDLKMTYEDWERYVLDNPEECESLYDDDPRGEKHASVR